MALAVGEEYKIKEGMSRFELGVVLEYWQEKFHTDTGKVLVDLLTDLEDFKGLYPKKALYNSNIERL